MTRQSISLTDPNDEWLKQQVNSEEYSSKSELINDLIRQARNQQKELDWVRSKLEKAEKRIVKEGYVNQSQTEILKEFKHKLSN